MEPEIIKPFGPSILKIKIPDEIVREMNLFVDEMIKDHNKIEKFNEGPKLAGNVSQEFLMDPDFMKQIKWGEFLGSACDKWLFREKNLRLKSFQIIKSWIVRQFKNEYNPTHWHGGHISGAGFLKVPKVLGDNVQKKKQKQYRGGNLQLIHGARMFTCPSTYNIVPQVGDFYIFPNYLMHTVFPFKDTDEERRSISFNGVIDEEIYNVYGK